jgi:hypothetical protein
MKKKSVVILLVVALSLIAVVPAFAAGPNFGSAIYADGETFGTKGTASLPAPTENNRQSFDGLFKIMNGVEGQLAVAEAAPGNPAYNGGRWIEYFVEFVDPADAVLVTSYAQLHALAMANKVTIVETGAYFQCPLLPDKSS